MAKLTTTTCNINFFGPNIENCFMNSFSECMKMTLNKYICQIPNTLYIPLMCIGKDSTWTSEVYSR